uniref:Uncharacterized protein n=1 Tax=Mogami virus TaxID=2170597 RepID=A0A2S0S4M7_9VIRU|nr:hypothetical protein [Mogami virus]
MIFIMMITQDRMMHLHHRGTNRITRSRGNRIPPLIILRLVNLILLTSQRMLEMKIWCLMMLPCNCHQVNTTVTHIVPIMTMSNFANCARVSLLSTISNIPLYLPNIAIITPNNWRPINSHVALYYCNFSTSNLIGKPESHSDVYASERSRTIINKEEKAKL